MGVLVSSEDNVFINASQSTWNQVLALQLLLPSYYYALLEAPSDSSTTRVTATHVGDPL